MQIESAKHRELLLVPVSFFAHEKGGISHRSEFIMSIDHIRILGIGLELACNGG